MKKLCLLMLAAIMQLFAVSAMACTLPNAGGTSGAVDTVAPITALGYINTITTNGTDVMQVTYTTTGGTSTTTPVSLGASSGMTVTGSVSVGIGGRIVTITSTSNTITFTSSTGVNAGTLTLSGGTTSGPSVSWLGTTAGLVQVQGSGSGILFTGFNANTSSNSTASATLSGTCTVSATATYTGVGNTLDLAATAAEATQVEFFVDSVSMFVDNSVPFAYSTAVLGNGPHTYSAKATFAGGTKSAGSNIPVNVLADTRNGTSCAVVANAAYCWGNNSIGQVGNGTTGGTVTQPVQVTGLSSGVTDITVMNDAVCAIHNNIVKCWGNNANSILGVTPATLASSNVPYTHPSFSATTVSKIDGGNNHACALNGSSVKCWGSGSNGQIGSFSNSASPLTLVTGASDVKSGANFSCALVSGAAKCWGANASGQIGNNSATANFATAQQVSGITSGATVLTAGATHACAVHSSVTKCWGSNTTGELGTGSLTPTLSKVPVNVSGLAAVPKYLAGGDGLTCAVLTTGELRCWGNDSSGQMGQGTTSSYSLSPVVPTGFSSGVMAANAGSLNVCSVMNQHIYCWGDNTYGQIGNNSAPNPTLAPFQVFGF